MKLDRYQHPVLRQFAEQQTRFAPLQVRVAQMERIENLVLTLNIAEPMLYRDLVQEITSRPTELFPELSIDGAVVMHDMLLLVEHLSESTHLDSATTDEPVLTQEDISRKYNVSMKTVTRWRDRGLAGRRFRFGNRRRIGFLLSHVERYVELHRADVDAGSHFSHLSVEQREWVIRRARRLAHWGATQTQIITRLAKRMGRSVETLRYTIKQHDEQFPTAAIFPDAKVTMTETDRREIYVAMKRGESPTRLAKTYQRTRSTIHRVAKEYRRDLLMKLPLECFVCDEFATENADDLILNPPDGLNLPDLEPVSSSSELPAYFSDLYAFPVLTREQEHFLFRKMNYLVHKMKIARDRLPRFQPDVASMDAIDQLLEASQAVKNVLIRCNLRLVVSVARKHKRHESAFFEMISDGNMVVIRAIEKFDYTRGIKFSTYATWALMRHYARYRYSEFTYSDRYRSAEDETMDAFTEERGSVSADESLLDEQRLKIESILDQLDEREQEAVSLRFGLGQHTEPMTLEQIADRLGVTKERGRQIVVSALKKLRDIAEPEGDSNDDSAVE